MINSHKMTRIAQIWMHLKQSRRNRTPRRLQGSLSFGCTWNSKALLEIFLYIIYILKNHITSCLFVLFIPQNQRSPLPPIRESSPHGTETDPNQIAKNDTFKLDKRDFHLPTGSKSTFFPRAETMTQEHNLPSASAGLGMSDRVWLDLAAEEACRRLLLKDENERRLPCFTEFCPQPKRNCTKV